MTTEKKKTMAETVLSMLTAKLGLIDWETFTAKDADKRMEMLRGLSANFGCGAVMKGATV